MITTATRAVAVEAGALTRLTSYSVYAGMYNSRIGNVLIVRKHAAKPIAIHTLPELEADNAAPGN